MYHDLHGADLHTLATADAVLLVDHINAGLRILGDRTVLTSLHALAALDAGHRLSSSSFCHDLDAGIVGVELLVKRLRACTHALQASHAFNILFDSELLHNRELSF